ncbi:MAG: potassium channel family protein [Fimbriimonas sp.]
MRLLRDSVQFLAGLFVHKPTNLRRKALPHKNQEFAVLGLGRFGSSLAKTLVERGHTVLGVDRDPLLVQQYADEITQTVSFDITDEDALNEMDIASYDTVVVAMGTNFEASVMSTVALKSIGVRNVVCKAATVRQRDILLRIGADRVVLPEHESGTRLAHELSTPGILDQIRLDANTVVTELRLPLRCADRTIGDLQLERDYSISVVAVARAQSYVACPPRTYALCEGDVLIVIGPEAEIVRLIVE